MDTQCTTEHVRGYQTQQVKHITKLLTRYLGCTTKAVIPSKRIECDGEYEPLMEKVQDDLDIEMNYANPGDHVPQAEQNNRTIKECIRTWHYNELHTERYQD